MIFDLDKSIEGSMINFTFLAFSRVLVQILHLVTLAVITRQLGPEMYGKMSLFLMVTQFLYLITGSWTAVGYTRYSIHYSIEKKQVSEVLWCRSFIVLILVLLFGLMLIIGKNWLLSYLELTSPVIYLVIFHLFSLLAMDYTRQIAQVTTQFNKISILQVVEKVLILVVVLLWGEDIFSVLGLIIAAAFGCRTWFFFSLGKNFYWPFRINISLCKQLLRFSFPLLLVSLGGFIFGWVDIAVIKHLCHFRDVGIYSLAYSGLGAIESVVLLMPTILTPIFVSFASQKRDGMTDRFIQRVLPQISYLWGGVFMLAGLGSIWGIPVVFGQSFSKATNIFLVLLICLNLGVLNALGLSIFVSYDMVSKMSIINFAASIVNLVLDLILVPVIGIVGAAFATTVSYFVISASYYILVKKLFYFSVKNLLIFQGIVCIQLTGLLVFKDPVIYFVITLTAAGMYFVSSKYMGIFSEEDKTTYNRLEMPVFLKKTFIRICDYYG